VINVYPAFRTEPLSFIGRTSEKNWWTCRKGNWSRTMDLPRMLERPALYPAPRNLFKGTVTILSKVNPLLLKEDDLELDAPVSQVLSAALNRTVYR